MLIRTLSSCRRTIPRPVVEGYEGVNLSIAPRTKRPRKILKVLANYRSRLKATSRNWSILLETGGNDFLLYQSERTMSRSEH